MVSRQTPLLVAVLLIVCPMLVAQAKKEDEPLPDLPIAQWLKGPDRQDYRWRVELSGPRLTFQQRNLLQITAYVDVASKGEDATHDLYFVLKIADEKGNWLPEDTFNHYPVPPGVDRKNEIQYSSGVYAKPGRYTAALIVYDVTTGKGNLWRKQFEVKPPKGDPLPQMDRQLPVIEFIKEVPGDALVVPEHRVISFRRRVADVPRVDPEWPLGHGVEYLPVPVAHPTRVDVILNVAPHVDPDMLRRNGPADFRNAAGRVLEAGSVLSHLSLRSGCVRVSAVDLAKLNVIFDRVDGASADWDKLSEQVRKIDHNTISVDILGKRKSSAGFLRDYVSNVMTDTSGCGGTGNENRAIIVVSHEFQFPSGTHGDRLWPDVQCACRYYYIRFAGSAGDDVDKFMKPTAPRRFDVSNPEQFRKVLAGLIDDLSGGRARAREAAQ